MGEGSDTESKEKEESSTASTNQESADDVNEEEASSSQAETSDECQKPATADSSINEADAEPAGDQVSIESQEPEAENSDDEVVVHKKKGGVAVVSDESDFEAKNSDDEVVVKKKKVGLFKCLNDSDFSEEEETSGIPYDGKRNSDDESRKDQGESKNRDRDSEVEEKSDDDVLTKKVEMFEKFHGSDSSDEERLVEEKKTSHDKKEKKKRKPKALVEDEKLKIYSETQRLMREKEISLPYHKPKQRTLKEFLNRKKKSNVNVPLTSAKKMQDVWKEIEESTQSVSEFFKSDSEGETENSKNKIQTEELKVVQNDESKMTDVEESKPEEAKITEENMIDKIKKNLNFEEETSTNDKIMEVEISETRTEESVMMVEESKDNVDSNFSSTKDLSTWMSDILQFEKVEKQNNKKNLIKRINPKLLSFTPKLSSGPDLFLELNDEKDDLRDGAKKLLDRFVKNCIVPKKKCIKKEFDLTVASEERNVKGEVCSLVTEKVTYKMEEIAEDIVEVDKPGAKLQKLRMELQTKMAEKFEEEYKKKMEEEKEYTVARKKEEELEEEWEEEEIEDEESEAESEPEENDVELVDKKTKKSKYIESEAEESGEEAGDELDDDDDDEKEADEDEKKEEKEEKDEKDEDDDLESQIPAYQPGGGFLNGGSTLTQPEDKKEDGLASPSFTLTGMTSYKDLTPLTQASEANFNFTRPEGAALETHRRKLFDDNIGKEKFDLDDAFEFCSGRFPGASQNVGSSQVSQESDKIKGISQLIMDESQEPIDYDLISGDFGSTQKKFFSGIDDELGEGWLDTGADTKSAKKRITVLEDDESTKDPETFLETESNSEPAISNANRIASDDENDNAQDGLLIFNKKTKKNLKFSDDEDDDDDNANDDEKNDSDEDDDNPEPEEKNEESEVEQEPEGEVDYDSEENEIIHPTEFIEKEAELSDSEWSGDEDEKNLDFLDVEAGDQDQLDQDQVKSQLEKIHMRRVMDDDQREVRLLQELFFEDGDLHSDGKGRDRKFRWKNIGAFDNDDNNAESGGESQDEDGEQEERLRKMRHERAVFLLEMKKKGEIKSDDENDDDENSLLKLGRTVLEKCTKTVLVGNSKVEDEDSLSKKPFSLVNKRGSFLSRNEQFLSRLAKFTSGSDNLNGPKNSKNFVFTTKSPEKTDPKRKLQDCNETARITKRKKLDASNFPSLLDQLVSL